VLPGDNDSDSETERRLIDEAVRLRDERAFERLVAPHRGALRAHCYRFLGSVADADDAVQDALLGAWQGIASFEGRSAFRSWLFTIATHSAMRIAARRSTPHRIRPQDQQASPSDPRAPLPEMRTELPWLEPFPRMELTHAHAPSAEALYSEAESIELAFVAALQWLPATQRAVLILRDVLGFSARETADALHTTVAAANSALQRARETLAAPTTTQSANRRAIGEEAHRRTVDALLAAWMRADVDAVVALLAEDATFTMPPLPCWFRGRDDLRVFFAERVFALRWRFVATQANGEQPAIAGYQWHEESKTFRFEVLNVLDLHGDRIRGINAFLDVAAERFGLPRFLIQD